MVNAYHVVGLTLFPSVLDVLGEKGEVEGQCFLPCSLVVQEASLEETVNEQENSFPDNTVLGLNSIFT